MLPAAEIPAKTQQGRGPTGRVLRHRRFRTLTPTSLPQNLVVSLTAGMCTQTHAIRANLMRMEENPNPPVSVSVRGSSHTRKKTSSTPSPQPAGQAVDSVTESLTHVLQSPPNKSTNRHHISLNTYSQPHYASRLVELNCGPSDALRVRNIPSRNAEKVNILLLVKDEGIWKICIG